MDNLDKLIEKVYSCDNLACFIEREEILFANRAATEALPVEERYLHEANLLFNGLSTPIEPEDVFAGRMGFFNEFHAEGFVPELLVKFVNPEIAKKHDDCAILNCWDEFAIEEFL